MNKEEEVFFNVIIFYFNFCPLICHSITAMTKTCPKAAAHLGFLFGRGGFIKLGYNFIFFQINGDKLKACVVILDLRGLKVIVTL